MTACKPATGSCNPVCLVHPYTSDSVTLRLAQRSAFCLFTFLIERFFDILSALDISSSMSVTFSLVKQNKGLKSPCSIYLRFPVSACG